MKTTATYWNPLAPEHEARWEVIDGSDGNLLQLTIAEDPKTGDYTRLTKFPCLSGWATMRLPRRILPMYPVAVIESAVSWAGIVRS